jgi:hypothetical protein
MNVKQSSEQCRTTIPLLQTAMSETKAADLSVHERIEQQAATIIVLKKMRENLQPARTGILLRCEQAGQFITLQQYLVRDSSAVVVQVRFACAAIMFSQSIFISHCTHRLSQNLIALLLGSSVARGPTGRELVPSPGLHLPSNSFRKGQHRPRRFANASVQRKASGV